MNIEIKHDYECIDCEGCYKEGETREQKRIFKILDDWYSANKSLHNVTGTAVCEAIKLIKKDITSGFQNQNYL